MNKSCKQWCQILTLPAAIAEMVSEVVVALLEVTMLFNSLCTHLTATVH